MLTSLWMSAEVIIMDVLVNMVGEFMVVNVTWGIELDALVIGMVFVDSLVVSGIENKLFSSFIESPPLGLGVGQIRLFKISDTQFLKEHIIFTLFLKDVLWYEYSMSDWKVKLF